MAREYMQYIESSSSSANNSNSTPWSSILDTMLVGTVRTQSASSLVTDSAAGATAFACALKTYNGAVGVDPHGRACGTILEAAKAHGYLTALVTSARITHATPASFAAHIVDRDMEDLAAIHMLAQNATTHASTVDIMLGGGRCHFLPQSDSQSCRSDDTNVWTAAQRQNFATLQSRSQFEMLQQTKLPILGLFAQNHMAFEIDRKYSKDSDNNDDEQPSLSEMAVQTLERLHKSEQNTKGFFVMIEGARIDMAAHDNDPATHVRDIIEYWRTVARVREFAAQNPDTLVISTSDHETGGLTLGIDPEYLWHPSVLRPIRRSADAMCTMLRRMSRKSSHTDNNDDDNDDGDDNSSVSEFIAQTLFPEYLGITNHTKSELLQITDTLHKNKNNNAKDNDDGGEKSHGHKKCKRAIGAIVSQRAHVGWSTGGHTGADVGLYAYGNHANMFHGNMENTRLGELLMEYLDVDTQDVTKALNGLDTRQAAF
ncbi:vacuolar alkaline phosphatase, partial [Coemansia sp. RSA 2618]